MKNFVIAATEFLRRGIINPKSDAMTFANWCKQQADNGNVVNYPERVLRNWHAKQASTITPMEGAMIADFVEAIGCNDLDAICAITKVEVLDSVFVVWLSDSLYTQKIDGFVFGNAAATKQYIATYGAKSIEYRQPRGALSLSDEEKEQRIAELIRQHPPTTEEIQSEDPQHTGWYIYEQRLKYMLTKEWGAGSVAGKIDDKLHNSCADEWNIAYEGRNSIRQLEQVAAVAGSW
ncbi:MAG: hypothetical protein IJ650_05375 [Paludibacteraceae bacterium]|nr:hypothetical protein [Paludibacteraceae bacterium]